MAQLTTGRISLRRTGTYAGAPVAGFVTALHMLNDYAEVYRETYGQTENVVDLIPYMLQSFLDGDRGFVRGRAKS